MFEIVGQKTLTLIIFSGRRKNCSILFHEFGMYFILLLRYFYNNFNKPIIIINANNIHFWNKVSNNGRCTDLWNGDIWCTFISKSDSYFKAINCRNKTNLKNYQQINIFFFRENCLHINHTLNQHHQSYIQSNQQCSCFENLQ